jgi:thioredoxin reductase (NADPH)
MDYIVIGGGPGRTNHRATDIPQYRGSTKRSHTALCVIVRSATALKRLIFELLCWVMQPTLADACGKALFLRSYSKSVTLLTLDDSTPEREACAELAAAGVTFPAARVSCIDHASRVITITLTSGQRMEFDALYPVLGCDVRSTLATALGAAQNRIGCLVVDQHQETDVAGLYAIGDVVSDLHQIAVGTGHAALAATHLHHTLQRNLR